MPKVLVTGLAVTLFVGTSVNSEAAPRFKKTQVANWIGCRNVCEAVLGGRLMFRVCIRPSAVRGQPPEMTRQIVGPCLR
jgi:hypothetical protein